MNHLKSALLALLVLSLVSTGCRDSNTPATDTFTREMNKKASGFDGNLIDGQYIVVLSDVEPVMAARASREDAALERTSSRKRAEVQAEARAIMAEHSIATEAVGTLYTHALAGFVINTTAAKAAELAADKRVKYIEQDREVRLPDLKIEDEGVNTEAQSTPWGITRVGGAGSGAGLSRWAFVVDSGIDLDHPDLTVSTQYSRTFVNESGGADDRNGHGTHVAGTIAARNNTIGVVGVAAGATVVAVKVFTASGSSANSIIISGIDYVAQTALAGDVANLSLGGGASTATDDAVRRCASRGIRMALAAGNEAQNANNVSPARTNGTNIWTISAHDINDRFASFSNFGNPPVDFCAPGVSVNSTYLNGGYARLSGTSMATPHVAGILLLNNGTIGSRGNVIGDPDGNADVMARR
jgi:hypothetical protein